MNIIHEYFLVNKNDCRSDVSLVNNSVSDSEKTLH